MRIMERLRKNAESGSIRFSNTHIAYGGCGCCEETIELTELTFGERKELVNMLIGQLRAWQDLHTETQEGPL